MIPAIILFSFEKRNEYLVNMPTIKILIKSYRMNFVFLILEDVANLLLKQTYSEVLIIAALIKKKKKTKSI